MNDREFLDVIYRYAEYVKRAPLSQAERERIITEFNSAQGDPYTKAREAVRKVLGLSQLIEGMRKTADLDNTQRLLQDLMNAANQWQAAKNKK